MEWKLFWMEDIPWTFPDTRYVLPRLWVRGRWEWRCKTKLRPKSGSRGWSQTIQGTHQNSLDTKHRYSSLHEVSHIPCLSLYADFLGYCQTGNKWIVKYLFIYMDSVNTDLNIYEHAIGEDDDPRERHDEADALNIENIDDEVRLHETIPQSEHKCWSRRYHRKWLPVFQCQWVNYGSVEVMDGEWKKEN